MKLEIACQTCSAWYVASLPVNAVHAICWACGEKMRWDEPDVLSKQFKEALETRKPPPPDAST